MRRALRWVKRIVLGLLAFVLVVVVTVLILLHTDWGRNKARTIALSQLQKFFPGGIHVERIDGSVLGDISLHGVTINGFDGKQMLRAKTVTTNLKIGALFSKTIELEYATVDEAFVTDPSNPVKIEEDPEPGSWSVEMPRVEIRHGHFVKTGEQPMTIENLEVDAALAVDPVGPIVASAEVRGHWKERAMPVVVNAGARITEAVEISRFSIKLADTTVEATKPILVDTAFPTVKLQIHATPAVVTSFAPAVVLPAPADITIDIGGKPLAIAMHATMATSTFDVNLTGDIATLKAHGVVTASGIDLETFVPTLTGSGDGTLALVVDGKAQTAHVLALLRGQLLDFPAGHAMVDLDATAQGARALVIAGGDGDVGAAVIGRLAREGNKLDLVHAAVQVSARDAAKATGGQAPFKGLIRAGGTAKGTLAPKLAVRLDGQVQAYGLQSTDPKLGLQIAQVNGRADAWISEQGTFSHLHATLTKVSRAGSELGTFEVDAHNRKDGRISATLIAHPSAIPKSTATIDATVSLAKTETDPLVIELGTHTLDAPKFKWSGTGGKITVTDAKVEVRDFESKSGNASVSVDATVVKATQALEVKASAKNVPAQLFDPTYQGTVSADVDIKRQGLRWDGKVNVDINGIALGANQPAIEGKVALTVANRRVTADVRATTFSLGGVRLVLDVDGPRDITDPLGWRRLDRKAIRTAMLAITRIDLSAAKVKTGGIIDGELVLAGMDTSGTFAIKQVQTPLGVVEGEINFAPMGDELGVSSTVKVENFGDAQIAAVIAIPAHPFEPLEWKRLGRGIVRTLTAQIEDVVIDPKKLARLGLDYPYSARANVNLALAAGEGEVRAKVALRDIKGGTLLKPLDLTIDASITPKETGATVQLATGKQTLTTIAATLPGFGFERWVADAPSVMNASVQGKLEIPNIDVVETLGILGRIDITSGKLAGSIDVAGTVAKPTANMDVVVTDVNVKPRLAGRTLPTLNELRIKGTWDGATGEVAITGKESDGATLDISAKARLDNLAGLDAKVDIRKFDIAPIAVFLPGPLVAATGKLGAKITITGLDADRIRGTLSLEKARVPVHPQIGTVRDANVAIKLTDMGLAYTIDAKVGAGTVKIKGAAGKDLAQITVDGQVDKFSPIGEVQPLITAKLDGTIFREQGLLRGEMKLTRANVTLDLEQGVKLLDSEMPEDVYLGRSTPPPPTPKEARIPRTPWITLRVKLDSTRVYVKHEYVEVRALVNANRGVTLAIGRTPTLDGSIEIERGDVDVLGRQYRVDPTDKAVTFDGNLDPKLAIRLTHDFPTLSLSANLSGRVSKKEIHMTGSPDIYSQEELLAFFVGADPGGEAGSTSRDVATNVGAAILSAKLGRQAKKVLPFKVDVVACDAGTSASGSSCRLGRWLTENWFVQFKQRIEPRPDEPPQEVQLQYYFRKSWVFEGAGFTERFGGDVLWRKRW
jgi:hypothetical protein